MIVSSRISREKKNAIFKKIVEEVKLGQYFLISSHKNPEGDAIGSMLALGLALQDLQKKVFILSQDPTPEVLSFLPAVDQIKHQAPAEENFDAAFTLDCGDKSRLGEEFFKIRVGKIINIDHHISNNNFGDINLVDPQASSTAEIVFDLIRKLKIPLRTYIAENLYVGILTDTGSFHYPNTSAKAFQIAKACLLSGVDPWKVAERIYENQPISRLRLLALVLGTLEVFAQGQITAVYVTKKMLTETGATTDQTEDLINFPRAVRGAEVALLIREIEPHQYRVSMRSKGKVNVAQIAAYFRGGGHPNAAGCTVEGDLLTVKEKVLERLQAALGMEC